MRLGYQPRNISFLEHYQARGWRLKVYSILHHQKPLDPELILAAKETALTILPQPAVTKHHYGVGFISVHRGSTYDFVTTAYWTYETELRFHSFMRPSSGSYRLELVTASELSSDVWDLKLLAFERESWVECVLQCREADLEGYLAAQLTATL